VTARAVLERAVIHVHDITADPEYAVPETARLGRARTCLGVPLLREGEPIGVIALARQRVEPFIERQIELVRTFADQAVIAIENARLLTELSESLERQTATAEVLGVINASPGDLTPVFNAILEKAHTLCEATHGHLTIYDREQFRAVATHGVPEGFAALLRQPFRPERDVAQRLFAGEALVHIPDMAALTYEAEDRIGRSAVELADARTKLIVPLRKDGTLLGYHRPSHRSPAVCR
jgi:GAF domain-containing protein